MVYHTPDNTPSCYLCLKLCCRFPQNVRFVDMPAVDNVDKSVHNPVSEAISLWNLKFNTQVIPVYGHKYRGNLCPWQIPQIASL